MRVTDSRAREWMRETHRGPKRSLISFPPNLRAWSRAQTRSRSHPIPAWIEGPKEVSCLFLVLPELRARNRVQTRRLKRPQTLTLILWGQRRYCSRRSFAILPFCSGELHGYREASSSSFCFVLDHLDWIYCGPHHHQHHLLLFLFRFIPLLFWLNRLSNFLIVSGVHHADLFGFVLCLTLSQDFLLWLFFSFPQFALSPSLGFAFSFFIGGSPSGNFIDFRMRSSSAVLLWSCGNLLRVCAGIGGCLFRISILLLLEFTLFFFLALTSGYS